MEIIRITKVLFGLWSTLLLSISGIIVLDERFFRPLECKSRSIQLSSLYRGQQADAVPKEPSVALGNPILVSKATSDTNYFAKFSNDSFVSNISRSNQVPFSSLRQSPRLSFDYQTYQSLRKNSTHNNNSIHNDLNQEVREASLEDGFQTNYISDLVQRYTAMMWGDRTRLNLQDTVQGSEDELHGLENLASDEYELEYIALRKKGQRGGTRNRSSGGSRGSYTASLPQKKLKNGIPAKAKMPLTSKRMQRRRGASPAVLGAFSNHSRLRVKNRAAQGQVPPIVHLKPIAPGATIKPQSAHDAWKKKRQHPIFSWPVDPKDFWVSSPFGPRRKPNGTWALHAGVDLAACRGTPVRASREGRVIKATYSSGYGNYILIEHSKKYQTRYAHLDKILVRVGQSVCAGDYIGRVGSTGFVRRSRWGSSGSHLHFEVYVYGKAKNPFCFLA